MSELDVWVHDTLLLIAGIAACGVVVLIALATCGAARLVEWVRGR